MTVGLACVGTRKDKRQHLYIAADSRVTGGADVPARRKFLPKYERKYKSDMSAMKQDILSMKEPVFAVRPRVVFGLCHPERSESLP